MPFKKGQSGNPAGRRKNCIYRSDALRRIVEEAAPALVRKAVELALAGDTMALKLMIDKILPSLKSEIPAIPLSVEGATPAETARNITHHMAQGRLTPEQASAMMSTLAHMVQVVDSTEIVERLEQLEAARENTTQHAH